jgi:hypothetical protein
LLRQKDDAITQRFEWFEGREERFFPCVQFREQRIEGSKTLGVFSDDPNVQTLHLDRSADQRFDAEGVTGLLQSDRAIDAVAVHQAQRSKAQLGSTSGKVFGRGCAP